MYGLCVRVIRISILRVATGIRKELPTNMSIYPSPDKLDKAESKYALVILAAKRARQIKDGARRLTGSTSPNPLTVALEEIAAEAIIARVVEDPTVVAQNKALRPNVPTLEDIIGAGPVVVIDVDSDSNGRDLSVLRPAESAGEDDEVEEDDSDELMPVDAFVQDAPGLISSDDDDDDQFSTIEDEDE